MNKKNNGQHKWEFKGTADVRYGGRRIRPGDIVEANSCPGANYVDIGPTIPVAAPPPQEKEPEKKSIK